MSEALNLIHGNSIASSLRNQQVIMHVRDSGNLQRLLTDCGLTQEEAAKALEIDLEVLLRYCDGTQLAPKVVWLALERLRDLRQNSD